MMLPMRQRICTKLTTTVIVLQMAVLLTLWITPTWTPPKMKLVELLWAWLHEPTFYPFIALLIGGPILTAIAWCYRGPHRLWLVLAWVIFIAVLFGGFHDRVMAMIRVLWWRITE